MLRIESYIAFKPSEYLNVHQDFPHQDVKP